MKLKKLEISGFKSFPDKESIFFPSGISAVVGPNGCGKSNIVDALRWVMGEQSVKQLRGKAMEDVIFSGSTGKPPLNMAEVSLTLNNDNGSAPEELREYSEIMLTRRLYRSGESAYYINKRPCRLKDIHNVFLGSGLSTRSYAVIQQGSIGAIIDAGPEERRFFLEEAAGVTRFKRRRDEALRKVHGTNQNLLRITDIIAEIKRQMASLKRQARKAELYHEYQSQIRQLDVQINTRRYDDLDLKVQETNSLLTGLQDADVEHTSQIKQIDAAVEKVKLKRWQKDQEISAQKTEIFETQRSLDRAESDLSHHRQDIDRLTDEVAKLNATHGDLEEKDREIETQIKETEEEISVLAGEENGIRESLGREEAAARGIGDRVSELNGELDKRKTDLMGLVAQEARYKNMHQNVTTNRESLRGRLKQIDEEAARAEKRVTDCKGAVSEAQTHYGAYEQQISDLADDIHETEMQLQDKRDALGKQVKEVQILEMDGNKTKSKYSTLRKMEEDFEWYRDGVKAIMKEGPGDADGAGSQLNRIKADGLIGIMADTIEPKPTYEIPVEAALGESLQHILVKDQKAGLGLINHLRSANAGRSGFIPVMEARPLASPGQKKPDASKRLLNHVTVRPGFERVAEVLLGHVVVAGDIDEALETHNRNGATQTIVTKNGDIVTHQGIMVGGSKEKMSGILAKRREIRQLKREMEQLGKALESARSDQSAMEAGARDCEIQLQQLIGEKGELLNGRIEAEKGLYRASEDLRHAKEHMEIVHLEREQLTGQASDLDAEIANTSTTVTSIANAVRDAQDKVTGLSEEIGALSLEAERSSQAIVDLQLKLTASAAKVENSTGTIRRLSEFRAEGRHRIQQVSRDALQKQRQLAAATEGIAESEATLSTMYGGMKNLEEALESNEAIYQRIDSELKDSDGIISKIQTKLAEIAQKTRLLEMERSEQSIKRDNIVARLEEQYRTSFSDLRAGLPGESDNLDRPMAEMAEELEVLRSKIARINDVNLGAIKEYEQLQARFDFLCEHRDDLAGAIEDLHKLINKINRITQERFLETLASVNEKLQTVFPRLFEGGSAQLVLTEPDRPLETGVDYLIHPPGKRLTRMSLLSGGEKALSAIAFRFSIFLLRPASFCLMDEIDAPLDDANIFRFNDLLQVIGENSQIIMITHNRKTMEFADELIGITMADKGISKKVSVNLNQQGTADARMD